ncbi:uncharacterized [Tachysurus ichikawai]
MKRAGRTDGTPRDSTEQAWGDLLFSHHYSQFHQISLSQICRTNDETSSSSPSPTHKVKPSHQNQNGRPSTLQSPSVRFTFDMNYKATGVVSNHRQKLHVTNLAL